MSNFKGSFGQERPNRNGPNWLENWMEDTSWTSKHDDKSDKILEVDTWKPRNSTTPTKTTKHTKPNMAQVASDLSSLDSDWGTEKAARPHSASSRPKRNPFAPSSRGDYSDVPFGY